MKNTHWKRLAPTAALVALTSIGCSSSELPADLAGDWSGSAKIIVNWVERDSLPLHVSIAADGSATGTVGDADLAGARVKANRGNLGRKLDVKTDYILIGDLEGPLLADEEIQRDGIKVPFNLVEGRLEGGLHTTGLKLGGRERGILSAAELVLTTR